MLCISPFAISVAILASSLLLPLYATLYTPFSSGTRSIISAVFKGRCGIVSLGRPPPCSTLRDETADNARTLSSFLFATLSSLAKSCSLAFVACITSPFSLFTTTLPILPCSCNLFAIKAPSKRLFL